MTLHAMTCDINNTYVRRFTIEIPQGNQGNDIIKLSCAHLRVAPRGFGSDNTHECPR